MVLTAAAVVPASPLLVPAVARGAAVEVEGVRAAALAAVHALLATGAGLLAVVGDGPGYDARAGTGDLRGLGVDVLVPLAGGGPRLPLGLSVAAWLLRAAAGPAEQRRGGPAPEPDFGPLRLVALPRGTTAAAAAALGAALASAAPRVALLVVGDASACRTVMAPGALDDRAGGYDAEIARALAEVDRAALLALDPVLCAELLVAGRVPWQVLAGAAAGGPGWDARVTADEAPHGVGLLVATWLRRAPAGAPPGP